MKRFKSKQPVLYITGAVYLIYIALVAYDFSWSSQIWWPFLGPASWIIKMIFYEMAPLISLLFMGLPFLATLELVGAATLAFLVIVPLLPSATGHYLWEMFDFVNLEVRPVPRLSLFSLSLALFFLCEPWTDPSLSWSPFL